MKRNQAFGALDDAYSGGHQLNKSSIRINLETFRLIKIDMAGNNLFCSQGVGCRNAPCAFGFLQNYTKVQVCRDHLPLLVDQKVSTFDIEAFNLMETVMDAPVYEQRRRLRDKGVGNVDLLQAKWDKYVLEYKSRLERSQAELYAMIAEVIGSERDRVHRQVGLAKEQLGQLRRRYEELLEDKEFQLSEIETAYCELVDPDLPAVPEVLSEGSAMLEVPVAEALLGRLQAGGRETSLHLSERCKQVLVAINAGLCFDPAKQPTPSELLQRVQGRLLSTKRHVECPGCFIDQEVESNSSEHTLLFCSDCFLPILLSQ